jgi:hypothetical protein
MVQSVSTDIRVYPDNSVNIYVPFFNQFKYRALLILFVKENRNGLLTSSSMKYSYNEILIFGNHCFVIHSTLTVPDARDMGCICRKPASAISPMLMCTSKNVLPRKRITTSASLRVGSFVCQMRPHPGEHVLHWFYPPLPIWLVTMSLMVTIRALQVILLAKETMKIKNVSRPLHRGWPLLSSPSKDSPFGFIVRRYSTMQLSLLTAQTLQKSFAGGFFSVAME